MSNSKNTLDISKYYIPTAAVIILMVATIILLPSPKLSAEEQSKLAVNGLGSSIKSVELTEMEYPFLSKVGIGSITYTITYNDNTFVNRIVKGKLSMGYINTFPIVNDVPIGGATGNGKMDVMLALGGVSCSLSGSSASNQHTYSFAYDSLMATKFYTSIITVPCGTNNNYKFTISGWGTKNAINVPGTYRIYVEDRIMLPSGTTVADQNWFDMKVTGVATPIPTTTAPTSEGSIKVTSNIPAQVYIDGIGVGISGGTFPVLAGGHDVKVVQSGFIAIQKSVTVDYGTSVAVSVTLSPIPTVAPTIQMPPPQTTIPQPTPTSVQSTQPQNTPTNTPGISTLGTEQPNTKETETVTYEPESILSTTNILIVLVVALVVVVAYSKLYVQKGKRRK